MSKHFHFLAQANFHQLGARVRTLAMILVFVISLLGTNHSVASAAGTTYYVNNTVACSESGPGSMAQPFCTITKGASVAVAGDTVKVLAGTYAETVILNTKNGTDGNPITFQGSPGVTITGTPEGAGFGTGFALTNSSYIVIDSFKITNTFYKGIYAADSNHITISNNEVSNAGTTSLIHPYEQGIYLKNTTYSTITGNTTHHNTCIGIRLVNNSDYNTISYNTSYANFSVVETDAAGIELTGASHNTIYKNITYSNEDSGINIYVNSAGVGSSYNLIIGNLSYENGDHGIDHNNSAYNTVIGNTVQGNGTVGINFEGEVGTGSHHATVMNNISVGNGFTPPTGSFGGNMRVDSPSIIGTVLDYNLYNRESAGVQVIWNNTSYNTLAALRQAEPSQEVHSLEGDPRFVDSVPSVLRVTGVPYEGTATVGDYHLLGGSPAIDNANSGAPSHPDTDIEGHARVDDPGTANTGVGPRAYDDRGAYEFVPSGTDVLPTVTTQAVTNIAQTIATGNGNVTNLGVPNPTQHGVVWSTSANPTTLDSKTTQGAVSATGAFTSSITGLLPSTLYYVRAYASNAAGTAYGEEVSFTTLATSTVITTPFETAGTGAGTGWANPQYVTVDDANYATDSINANGTSDYLNGTNFGFNIPTDATINGIEVKIGRFSSASNRLRDDTVQLLKAGTRTGSNKASSAYWPTAIAEASYGNTSDLWGATWTPAQINASNFGITLRVDNTSYMSSATASVDYMQIAVTYTVSPADTTTAVNCGAGTAVVAYGSSATCVATVVRSSGSNTPTGNVTWTTNGGGTFATSPCTLSGSGGTATCSVTYTPNARGTGSHLISATYAGDVNFLTSSGTQTVTVTPLALTISGLTANSKIYDATTAATLTGTASLVGVVAGDTVNLGGTPVAMFADKNVGTAKPVTVSGYSISGTSAGNYLLTQPTASADITAKDITVSATGINKIYSGTTAATVNLSTNALAGDTVTPAYTSASFANKNVGASKPVTVDGISISGLDSGNYTLVSVTANTTASITPALIAVTANAQTKYVGAPDPVFTYSVLPALFSGDTFTGALTRVSGEAEGQYAIQQGTLSAGSNYTMTFVSANLTIASSTPSELDIYVGGNLQQHYTVDPHISTRASYTNLSAGPVKVVSTNLVPIMAAERAIFKADGVATSFSEMMAMPSSQLDTTYWLPWYNSKNLDTQIRLANVSDAEATIKITIGNVEMTPFTLAAGASARKTFPNIDKGPVKIESNVPLVVAERVIYTVNGVDVSFSEMMALPNKQLDTTYWLPWYNSKNLDTQIRIANVSDTEATIKITIGNVEMTPFTLAAGASARKTFPNIDKGPVKIESNVTIVAAERVIYTVDGVATSFSEMMALPNKQLDTTYWLPWYNSKNLDTQIRIANVSDTEATIKITIGNVEMTPFTLAAGASARKTFPNIDKGPVKIESNVPLVVAERVIYTVDNIATSFSEMMGLPSGLLHDTFWLPWYNSKNLDTQIRFGVP